MFLETPPGTHCYILFTFGYHFYNFMNHVFFQERTNDWREMMLHHIAAVALYSGFILANCMGVGVFGAWLHDLADCWVTITRFFNSFEETSKITLFTFVMMLFVWFYTRLLILPQLIYKALIYPRVSFPDEVAHFQRAPQLISVYLLLMQCLHIYWFILFINVAISIATKGTKSTMDSVEADRASKSEDKAKKHE